MAVTAFWYGKALCNLVGGETAGETRAVDYLSDTIKVMLCTASYVPAQDTHEFKSDITNEVSGTGYSAGGATLSNKTVTYTAGTNTCALDADDVTWSASTITARYAVIYDDTPVGDTNKPVLGYVDFGQDMASSNGAFTLQWASGGILTLVAG